ncbi:PQQ-like beta-propeller repeat protein [Novosphingopyxis baekryungensis]|jgi:outer membrane protein assembly factor BamB|uniref:outer membrane protein assembly factor BamB family protein n=1 Tax=Novosphingopyxis baekryungensis TaxID=279369 RepID=UPI0003B577FF|nr:PQQ-like beta-propeller repeat protein [Novosphingopyxis baekryungensis]
MTRLPHKLLCASALLALTGCGLFGGGEEKKTPTLGNRVAILGAESDAVVDPALATVPVVLPAPVANSEWAQPGGNAAKNLGQLALGTDLGLAWTASIKGSSNRARLAAAPVVSNGRLFVDDTDAVVYAFDAATGDKIWSQPLRQSGENSAILFGGGVAADGNSVYATDGLGDVVALDAATGAERWRVRPAGPLRGSPTISNNNIYVMSQDNQIFAIDPATGKTNWNKSGTIGQAGIFGVAAPAAAQGTVIAGYSTGELAAYRYENGQDLWTDALSRTSISTSVSSLTDIDADPVIDRGRVYAIGQGGRMAAYELISGQRIWEINIAGIATPVVAGDWVFVLTDDAKLLAVARTTGKIRWVAQLPEYRNEEKKKDPIDWKGPVLAGGRLIVANTRGGIWSVDPQSGTTAQLFEVKEAVSVAPIVASQTLYILDDGGRISAYR